jgi:hypothetical protein
MHEQENASQVSAINPCKHAKKILAAKFSHPVTYALSL